MRTRIPLRTALLAAAVLAGTAAATTTASAATAATTAATAAPAASVARTATASTGTGFASATLVRTVTAHSTISPKTAITCTITAYNPTYNGYPYGVRGTSSVVCTADVQQIYLTTGLYYDGALQIDSSIETGEDDFSSANGVTADPSAPSGSWTTGAIAGITYPAGYSPQTQILGEVYSSTISLQ